MNELEVLKIKLREIENYNKLKDRIINEIEIEQLLNIYEDEIKKINGYDGFYIATTDEKNEHIVLLKASYDENHKGMEALLNNYKIPINKENFISTALNNKKIFTVNRESPEIDSFTKKTIIDWNIKQFLLIPLIKDEFKIGIACFYTLKNDFDNNKKNEIINITNSFVSQLFNSLKYKLIKDKEKDIEKIIQINKEVLNIASRLNSLTSVEMIYELLLKEILRLFNFDYGQIFINENNFLSFKKAYIVDEYDEFYDEIINFYSEIKGYNISLSDGGTSHAYMRNSPLFFTDVQLIMHLPMPEKSKKALEKLKTPRTLLIMPIQKETKAIGVIDLFSIKDKIELSETDIEIIRVLCSFIGSAISNAELYSVVENQKKNLEEKNRIIEKDLLMAKKIQTNLISTEYKKIKNLNFSIAFLPMIEVGGDIYDIFQINKDIVRIFIADATGHGIQGSLSSMIIKIEYDKIKTFDLLPNMLLKLFNNSFVKNYINLNVFFTCVIIDIYLNNGTAVYSSAGHPDQYLLSGENIFTLNARGKMVGIDENTDYELRNAPFEKGDKLLLFTDGLFEEFSFSSEDTEIELGEEGLLKIIEKYKLNKPDELIKNILYDIEIWHSGNPVNDDITAIAVEIL